MRTGMTAAAVLTLFGLFFTGCAATTAPETTAPAPEPAAAPAAVETPAPAPVDPCEAALTAAIAKARETMKTAKDTCDGKQIEANPMWSMDYDGTVHLRVRDAAGTMLRDELLKP